MMSGTAKANAFPKSIPNSLSHLSPDPPLHDVRVTVTAEMRMPRWEPDSPPDSATLAWWSDFTARLLEHGRSHVRIAVDGAREITETLPPLEGSVSCDALTMPREWRGAADHRQGEGAPGGVRSRHGSRSAPSQRTDAVTAV
jgi:hypothetical protein